MDDQKGHVLNKGQPKCKYNGWNTPGPGSDTIRGYGLVGVGVSFLEEMCSFGA